MENFKDFIGRRHSYRKWTDQPVTEEELKTVLRAGLITPADKGPITELEFIVIDDKEKLDKLSNIKAVAGKMIGQAPVAIAVIAKHDHFDWIEEASAATWTMHLQALDLGLGSVWNAMRERLSKEGADSVQLAREILGVPENRFVFAFLCLGHIEEERPPFDESRLKWDVISYNTYGETK